MTQSRHESQTMTNTTINLLEPSPYASDDGHLIGRDPRTLTPSDLTDAGLPLRLAKDAIRARCLDCCGNDRSEVRKCVSVECALWPFRITGSLPPAIKRAALDS